MHGYDRELEEVKTALRVFERSGTDFYWTFVTCMDRNTGTFGCYCVFSTSHIFISETKGSSMWCSRSRHQGKFEKSLVHGNNWMEKFP